jgi:hypothetical protein
MVREQPAADGGSELGRFLRVRRTKATPSEAGPPDYDAMVLLDLAAHEHAGNPRSTAALT